MGNHQVFLNMKSFKEYCKDTEILPEESDKAQLYKLTRKALSAIAGSKAQKDILKKVNILRKKLKMKPLKEGSLSTYIQEVGFSGRPVRNTDPIQYMIRSILDGDMELNIVDKQPSIIKKRILRDITDIVNGKSLIWMPKKFKLQKKRQSDLTIQLKKYV